MAITDPDHEDFDEDGLTEEDIFLMDIGFSPEGERMTPQTRRADTGAPWHPSDDEGHVTGRALA